MLWAVPKYVYDLSEGSAEMRSLLGGKGANVAEMLRIGVPVPDGFTVTTEACVAATRDGVWPDGLEAEIEDRLVALEERTGRKLGEGARPLLVSVRSGAVHSMPGMMDTILNLGMSRRPPRRWPRSRATRGSRGTPTAASCRCTARSWRACRATSTSTR